MGARGGRTRASGVGPEQWLQKLVVFAHEEAVTDLRYEPELGGCVVSFADAPPAGAEMVVRLNPETILPALDSYVELGPLRGVPDEPRAEGGQRGEALVLLIQDILALVQDPARGPHRSWIVRRGALEPSG